MTDTPQTFEEWFENYNGPMTYGNCWNAGRASMQAATDTPRTVDVEPLFGYPAALSALEQPIYERGYQAGYEIGRCRSDADLAAKDRRIAELESEWRVREGYHQKLWNAENDKNHLLQAQIDQLELQVSIEQVGAVKLLEQIDRVRATAGEMQNAGKSKKCMHVWEAGDCIALSDVEEWSDEILAAIDKPAATPEREQKR